MVYWLMVYWLMVYWLIPRAVLMLSFLTVFLLAWPSHRIEPL